MKQDADLQEALTADTGKKHVLHVFGVMGDMHCYLDMSLEEAVKRYLVDGQDLFSKKMTTEDAMNVYEKTVYFDDCFLAYDVDEF